MDGSKIVALITDFGDRDHFVGSMKGVILKVDAEIRIFDISHNIEPQNILEASYTLSDTLPYWPQETIFVVVVDPGVGLGRKSLAVRTRYGHIVLCPDNGILTEVIKKPGLQEVRVISEAMNRLPGSAKYHTFHGRDIFAYDAARLASGSIDINNIGFKMEDKVVKLPLPEAVRNYKTIEGLIVKVEYPFGNICTNIPRALVDDLNIMPGDHVTYEIFESGGLVHEGKIPFARTFGEVKQKSPLAYIDSSDRLGLAVNMGNFSLQYKVNAGLSWKLRIGAA